MKLKKIIPSLLAVFLLYACAPKATIKLETDKPIEINLNVNINHKIKVQVDKELDSMFKKEENIF
ncbi:MAG: YnbE family lipoprotein [Bacteriovoracaceae bacterium]|nr:YnbE family lipoprotein [Bacteriovoracaceae bacterium]